MYHGQPHHLPYRNSPPELRKVEEVIKKPRSASALVLNGLPYKLYKNCPQVVKVLWKLMKTSWKKQKVSRVAAIRQCVHSQRAELPDHQPVQKHCLVKCMGEDPLFYYFYYCLMANGYIDTSFQKVGIPGFSGCVEHSSLIWDEIQWAKREQSDLCWCSWTLSKHIDRYNTC